MYVSFTLKIMHSRKRGAGQIPPCTPTQDIPAPRESATQIFASLRRARRPSAENTQAPSHADPRTATLHERAKLLPKALFLLHRARRVLFWGKTERGPRRAPRGGERRRKGAGAVFAAGGNGAERTLRRRQWGAHPRWTSPPAGAESPEAAARRPNRFPESLRLRAAGIIAPCGCGAVFPNSPRLLPGRQTNRPRPPPGGQGPCNGRFTSCRAAPSCASRGPEWPCASAGSWG